MPVVNKRPYGLDLFGVLGRRARSVILQASACAGTHLSPSNSLVIVEKMSILADDLRPHLAEDFRAVDTDRLNSLGEHYKGKVRDLFIGDDEITRLRQTVSRPSMSC